MPAVVEKDACSGGERESCGDQAGRGGGGGGGGRLGGGGMGSSSQSLSERRRGHALCPRWHGDSGLQLLAVTTSVSCGQACVECDP